MHRNVDDCHAADGATACVASQCPNGFKKLLEMGLEELGLDVVDALTRDFLVPLLSEVEADRIVGCN